MEKAVAQLVFDNVKVIVFLSVAQFLAKAKYDFHVVLQRGVHLEGNHRISLMKITPALRVSQNDDVHSDAFQHIGRNLARIGSARGLMHVLRSHLDMGKFQVVGGRRQVDKSGRHNDACRCVRRDAVDEFV